ncbi:unnamed protein product [Effrenium voratum]|nr:unnamed protein product [Effrenium voratum]
MLLRAPMPMLLRAVGSGPPGWELRREAGLALARGSSPHFYSPARAASFCAASSCAAAFAAYGPRERRVPRRRMRARCRRAGLGVAGDIGLLLAAPALVQAAGIYQPLWLIFARSDLAFLEHGLLLGLCWLVSAGFVGALEPDAFERGSSKAAEATLWRLAAAFFVNAWLLWFAASFVGLLQPFSETQALQLGVPLEALPGGFDVDTKVR